MYGKKTEERRPALYRTSLNNIKGPALSPPRKNVGHCIFSWGNALLYLKLIFSRGRSQLYADRVCWRAPCTFAGALPVLRYQYRERDWIRVPAERRSIFLIILYLCTKVFI